MGQDLKSAQCSAGRRAVRRARRGRLDLSPGRVFASSRAHLENKNGVTRLIDRCRSNEVRHSHQSQGQGRQILNLGMLFSANVAFDIDLCAMVLVHFS
jgi:hypothetical protein